MLMLSNSNQCQLEEEGPQKLITLSCELKQYLIAGLITSICGVHAKTRALINNSRFIYTDGNSPEQPSVYLENTLLLYF